MKLASYKYGRDGRLMVVSRDLKSCVSAEAIAPTLQAALDNWDTVEPQLQSLYEALNSGGLDALSFNEKECIKETQ